MRILAATLATESNTFSPLPTSLDSFRDSVFLRPGEHPDDAPRMCTAPLFVARERAPTEGFTLVEGSCFAASPAGTTVRTDYEWMRDEILDQVRQALPLDGVLLGLHGAMVAHGYDDVEGDLIERVREIAGPDCVIGVELDLHCHLTVKRVRLADVIVLYKEFPHTDVSDRAEELLTLVLRAIRGDINPVMSLYDCRQIGSYPTTLPLMRSFVDKVQAMEGRDGVLSISIDHCFPYADVPELGGRILVVMDGDKARGDTLATQIGQEFVSMRGKTLPDYYEVDAGIRAALDAPERPVVLADPADNAGGGAPSDNTTILRRLVELGVQDGALGPIWDPVAVRLCFDAGLGGTLPLRIGGKIGPASGQPLDAQVTVTGLQRDAWQSFGPTRVPVGDCAAVRISTGEAQAAQPRHLRDQAETEARISRGGDDQTPPRGAEGHADANQAESGGLAESSTGTRSLQPERGPAADETGSRYLRRSTQSTAPGQAGAAGDAERTGPAGTPPHGIDVVLISNRTQALGLELFRNVGIEPTERKVVVVKSTNHFMGAFGPIAGKVLYVDADGPLRRDYRTIPYTRVQRPIWPLDEETRPGLLL